MLDAPVDDEPVLSEVWGEGCVETGDVLFDRLANVGSDELLLLSCPL